MTTDAIDKAETVLGVACVDSVVSSARVRDAMAMFHDTWRPLVRSGAVTFGDWAASWTRAVGHRPSGDQAWRSGWCPFHPGAYVFGSVDCPREACDGVGCPGPAPKVEDETPEQWAARRRPTGREFPLTLSQADADGWCTANHDIRRLCGAAPKPAFVDGCVCGGRGCPGPAKASEPEPSPEPAEKVQASGPVARFAYHGPATYGGDVRGNVEHLTMGEMRKRIGAEKPAPDRVVVRNGTPELLAALNAATLVDPAD